MSFLQCARCTIPIVMSEAKREMQECMKVWESKVRAWESERERGRAKSNNAISRARDEIRSLETRSESQRGSERRGVKFYLFFLYVQGSTVARSCDYHDISELLDRCRAEAVC